VALWRAQPQREAQHGAREQQRIGHVVSIAHVRDLHRFRIGALRDREQVGHHLARVQQLGETVHDRYGRDPSELLHERVAGRADHQPIDPTREVARDVGGGFARPDPDLLGPEQDRVAAELRHARLERDARAERRVLEIHHEGATLEGLRPLPALEQILQLPRAFEHPAQLVRGPIGDAQKVLRHGVNAKGGSPRRRR
jgi:hypothetical protein